MLAAHNVGLRRQEGGQASAAGMDGPGTHRCHKGGGGATPTGGRAIRAQSMMARAASGEDALASVGDASERSDSCEVWTVEMAAQQEARINGRMGRLEDAMASIADRLAGLDSLLRRAQPVTTPQPSERAAGFFGAPGSESLKA